MNVNLSKAQWRKSSKSGGGDNCVEVARVGKTRAVRDSKHPERGALLLTGPEWKGFTDAVRKLTGS